MKIYPHFPGKYWEFLANFTHPAQTTFPQQDIFNWIERDARSHLTNVDPGLMSFQSILFIT